MLLLTTTTTNSCILPRLHNTDKSNDDEEQDKTMVAVIIADDDDDSSTCSSTVGGVLGTVTKKQPLENADSSRPPLANRMLERQQSERSKNVVRFNLNSNQAYDNTTPRFYKEDCARLWYTRRDYGDFKAANKMLVAQIVRSSEQRERALGRPSTMSRPLSLSWSSSSSSCTSDESSCSSAFSSSYQDILYRTYEACCKYPMTHPVDEADIDDDCDAAIVPRSKSNVDPMVLEDQSEQDELRQWLDIGTARLGLERSAVRDIARDRHYRYQDLVRVVLETQQQAQSQSWDEMQQRLDVDDDASDDSDEMMMMMMMMDTTSATTPPIDATAHRAEYLRQACQAITRPSRLFARQLARAQAAAVVPLC